MQQFNFEVTTDLSVINPQEITCNYEETLAWLENALAPYKGMVVTEDSISEAKTDRANIRKVRDAIDAQRKSVEKEWNAPLAKFKEQAKILAAKCDEAAANIDSQVKAFEKKRADEKIAALKDRYTELAQGFEEYASWEFVFNPRWANVTFSSEDAEKEIMDKISGVQRDLSAIEDMGSDFEPELLLEYRNTHDIRAVLEKDRKLREIREEAIRREKQKMVEPMREQRPTVKPEKQRVAPEAYFSVNLHIEGTRTQLKDLREFLDEREMPWEKI